MRRRPPVPRTLGTDGGPVCKAPAGALRNALWEYSMPNGATGHDDVGEVHAVVGRAQQSVFKAVRPGVECQEIDPVARRVITAAGHGECFIHRTGHGIGTTTHEPPHMVEGETLRLVPGMCFSIGPGRYPPGRFGVRIEDIVTDTDYGARRLNNTSHDLAEVH